MLKKTIETMIYNKCTPCNELNYNTSYYRRNKVRRFKVHHCPHCNFETTGPKSSLQAHIWAKHTEEKDRPFQCPCSNCTRGYSARANLHKHLSRCHDIKIPKDKDIFAYHITLNNMININDLNNETNSRLEYYKNNMIIPKNMKNVPKNITQETIYFDKYNKLININKYTINDINNLTNN